MTTINYRFRCCQRPEAKDVHCPRCDDHLCALCGADLWRCETHFALLPQDGNDAIASICGECLKSRDWRQWTPDQLAGAIEDRARTMEMTATSMELRAASIRAAYGEPATTIEAKLCQFSGGECNDENGCGDCLLSLHDRIEMLKRAMFASGGQSGDGPAADDFRNFLGTCRRLAGEGSHSDRNAVETDISLAAISGVGLGLSAEAAGDLLDAFHIALSEGSRRQLEAMTY